jgi:hypothetical protein
MPAGPIRTAVKVDFSKSAKDQPCLHNRWHPDSMHPLSLFLFFSFGNHNVLTTGFPQQFHQ